MRCRNGLPITARTLCGTAIRHRRCADCCRCCQAPETECRNDVRSSFARWSCTRTARLLQGAGADRLEREDAVPVVSHADDGPAFAFGFVVEHLREGADL